MLHPSLDLFLSALIVGAGFALSWSVVTWLFGQIVSRASRD